MDPDHPDAEDAHRHAPRRRPRRSAPTTRCSGSAAPPRTTRPHADRRLDLDGRAVVPAFVDSHTHLVFAGDRSAEFDARMTGAAYDGGGIASTVAATRAASDDELRRLLADRVAEMHAQGTGVVEVKSGYGLDVATETRLCSTRRRSISFPR